MKARLAVLLVAFALALAGALHHGHASRSAISVPPAQLEPMQVDPGGWWDWH